MSLIESLNQVTQKQAEAPTGGQTEQARKLIASRSGKAGATSGPVASSVGEKQALAEAAGLAEQQAQSANVQAAERTGRQTQQSRQADTQRQAISQQRQNILNNAARQETQLIDGLRRAKEEGRVEDYKQQLAQATFIANLANEQRQYAANQQIAKQNITDLNQVDLEIQRNQFDSLQNIFQGDLDFQSILNMDEQDFQKQLKAMDLQTALDIKKREARGGSVRTGVSGVTQVAGSLLSPSK